MEKTDRLIVLVDLSEHSAKLVDFALQLATCMEAKVVLVHRMTEMVPAMADHKAKYDITRAATEEALERLEELAGGRIEGSDQFIVRSKSVLGIVTELRSPSYRDWVIGGMKEGGLLKRVLFGSTLTSIIDNADLLTMAVPLRRPMAVPTKLLIAVTHRYALNEVQLKAVLSSLRGQVTEVEFFTILDRDEDRQPAKDHLLRLQDRYSEYGPTTLLLQGDDRFEELKRHADQAEHTFLVLQQGSRSFMDEILRKYMVTEIVHDGNIPLIVLSA